jgi:mannitol/fructose-specific phosphotransferase system IIA component (Ntr-type)
LLDVLTLDAVQIIEQVEDYQEAIRLGSRPLLKKGQITSNYIQSMIESHNMDDSYIVLGNEVAIPHSRPEEGVNELAVSLLHVRQGVNFSRSERVHFVFIIAPINQESHINALFEIMSIAEDEHRLRYMRTCSTPQELLNSLKLGEGEEDK